MSRKLMRIAMMLESDGPGGAETMSLRLALELVRRGHSIAPVVPLRGVGWLGDQYRNAGLEPHTFYLDRTLDPGLSSRLARFFRDQRIDVAHSHEFTMAFYGSFAARLTGTRHVVTMHGGEKLADVLRRRLAMRIAARLCDVMVTISQSTREQMCRDIGMSPARLGVIANGVPVVEGDPAPIRKELGIDADEFVIVAIGNLDSRKAHIDLLRGVQLVRSQMDKRPWRIIIAGGRGGPEKESLEAFAAEHNFSDRLHLLLNRTDIPNVLAAATVFAMPSLWEGLPMAMLEAMVAGKAVVASNVSGIPEAVTHGTTGMLFPPGDPAAIAGVLNTLLADDQLLSRLGAAGRKEALSRFTVAIMADQYEALYRGEVGGRTHSAPAPIGVGSA